MTALNLRLFHGTAFPQLVIQGGQAGCQEKQVIEHKMCSGLCMLPDIEAGRDRLRIRDDDLGIDMLLNERTVHQNAFGCATGVPRDRPGLI